jgi:hypothetical protein
MPDAVEIIHEGRSAMLLPSNDPRRIAFEAAVAERLRADREAHAARIAAEPVHSAADCRAALRAAIQKHVDLTQRLADLVRAVPKAESAVFAARTGVEQASAAVEDAKREASSQAVAAAVGKASGTTLSIAKARRVLEAAQDELETARTAAAALTEQRREAEQALSSARWDVDRAVAAVVRSDPATQKLIEVFKRACRELADLREAVESVASHFPQMERLRMLSERIDEVLPSERRAQWERAIMALQEDASATLPV